MYADLISYLSRCPETDCNTEINPYILQEVLDKDAYLRWEKLNLQVCNQRLIWLFVLKNVINCFCSGLGL